MKGNVLIIILIILNLLVLGFFGYWFYQEKVIKKSDVSVEASPFPETTPAVSPAITPTPEPTSSPVTKTDLELIQEAFAEKYDKPVEEVEVNISENTGTHASGGVKFAGEVGGGMWLAYKGAGGWVIVFDGHGTIPCEPIELYDFPVDLVPECFDETTGTVVVRE